MRFLPRTEAFFDLLEEDATLLTTAAAELLALAGGANATKESAAATEAILARVDACETRCAEISDRTVAALRVTFLTPLDRDDLFVLATAIERALSALVTAAHTVAHSVANGGASDGMPALAKPGHAAVQALAKALGKMGDAKHRDVARAACDAVRKAGRETERARRTFARSLAVDAASSPLARSAGDALALVGTRAFEAADAIEAALLDA